MRDAHEVYYTPRVQYTKSKLLKVQIVEEHAPYQNCNLLKVQSTESANYQRCKLLVVRTTNIAR